MSKKISRRKFLEMSATGAAGLVVAACTPAATPTTPPTPEVIKQQVEVTRIVAGTPIKEIQVVTATPPPVVKQKAADVLGVLPRSETLISDILTGHCGTPSNFNDWVGWKNRDRGMQTLAFEPLWSVDFATGKIINGSATGDPKYNSAFTHLEIPLRKGVTWDDGQPFTAADVVFTVQMLLKYKEFNGHSVMDDNVASVSAPDDYTVAFDLKAANSRFHTTFLDRWGCTQIMPKHIFEKEADPIKFEFNPFVGTGAYKLHSFDPNGDWTIWVKRADWDKSPTGILYGEPKVKYIVYQNFANEGAKILAQLTHQCDATNLSSDGLKAVLSQGKSMRAYQPTYPWVVNNDPCITGMTFNTARKPYDNREVRWALLLALEIGEYLGTAVDGAGTLSPVHIPSLGSYPKDYIKPMQQWLSDFTLDLGNGETFKPYDPTAPKKIIEYAKGRGYVVPTDPATQEQAFGLGWYKYAPDIAEKLLIKNGFKRDKDKKWLLPDGKPWKIQFLMNVSITTTLGCRNGVAAVQAWKKFGIDAETYPNQAVGTLTPNGDFDLSENWPAQEPWGAGADLYRTLDYYNSAYIKPLGQLTQGHPSRWSSKDMDAVIAKLRGTDPADYAGVVAVGTEGLKILVRDMPGIPTFGYIGFVGWDQTYWTNWPGSENPYTQPYCHWGPFKYMTPFLKPTGA